MNIITLIKVYATCLTLWYLPYVTAQQISVVTEYLPPLQSNQSGSKISGLTADVVTQVIRHTGYPFETAIYPWARSYRIASSRENTLIFPIIRNSEREEKFHWIGKVWQFKAAIYGHRGKKTAHLDNLKAAKNYRISVYRNDFLHHYLLDNGVPETALFPVASIEKSIELFSKNRTDLIIIDPSLLEYYIKKHNLRLDDFSLLFHLDQMEPKYAYMALSKSTSADVVQKFQHSYRQITSLKPFSHLLNHD